MSGAPGFVKVSTAAVRALALKEQADFEVFLPGTHGEAPVLYRGAQTDLVDPEFTRVSEAGVSELYLRAADYPECQRALEKRFRDILRDPSVGPTDKAAIIQTTATAVADDYVRQPVSEVGTERASTMVDGMVESVLEDPLVAAYLVQMAGHERSTASHMFAVSTLAIVLGSRVYGPDADMLRMLAFAGLFHDLGKLSIDPEILNKQTPLTRPEVEIIHQHPIESVRLIGDAPHILQPTRQMILQHHERIDGRGYPLGIGGTGILLGTRILSIVDSFHAMIGPRSYRAALDPPEANAVLATQAGRQFDSDLLNIWMDLFDRCWNEEGLGLNKTCSAEEDELSTRHEHRPKPPVPKIVHQRSTRFACRGHTIVQCVYAGRLSNVTAAPNEFGAPVFDVSRTGLCIHAAHPMYRGEIIHVRINLQGEVVWVRGQVAWCRQDSVDTYRIGVRFTGRISDNEKDAPTEVANLIELSRPLGVKVKKDGKDPTKTANPVLHNREPVTDKNESAMKTLAGIASMRRPNVEAQRKAVILAMSGDSKVRLKAVDVLLGINTRTTREAMVALLKDPNPQVREAVVQAVGTANMTEAIGALQDLLRDEVDSIGLSAAGALGKLGDESGMRLVAERLHEDGPVARLAARALSDITGHRFPANREGIKAARRYLEASKLIKRKKGKHSVTSP